MLVLSLEQKCKGQPTSNCSNTLRMCLRFFIVAFSHSLSRSMCALCVCVCGHRYGQSSELFYSQLLYFLDAFAFIFFCDYNFHRTLSLVLFPFICSLVRTSILSFILSSFQFFFRHSLTTFSRSGFRLTTKYQYYLKRC